MTDLIVVGAIESVSRTWHEEAVERRRISKTDPIADTLDYCAGELAARLRDVASMTTDLTVEEYAQKVRVTPQTVRTWIRREELPAQHGPKGYRIPVTAVRTRKAS